MDQDGALAKLFLDHRRHGGEPLDEITFDGSEDRLQARLQLLGRRPRAQAADDAEPTPSNFSERSLTEHHRRHPDVYEFPWFDPKKSPASDADHCIRFTPDL